MDKVGRNWALLGLNKCPVSIFIETSHPTTDERGLGVGVHLCHKSAQPVRQRDVIAVHARIKLSARLA
jgi:hypothetical protein